MSDILCSITFPTRGRIEGLRRCIREVAWTCINHNRIEFVLRFDDDDKETPAALPALAEECQIQIKGLCNPRHQGTFDEAFVAMFAECCSVAQGKWIWQLSNDGGVMPGSYGWDAALAEVSTEKTLCSPSANIWNGKKVEWSNPHCGCHVFHFPIMPNKWWEQFNLKRVEAPVDNWTLNFLTGRGHGPLAVPERSQGWSIRQIPGLVTWHEQNKDEVFQERGRVSHI